ncbi:MAG: hypothetical protein L0G94_10195 [Brachybacterium sp.]|uniref:hypothetical protein n=1 Tax=Brachybacterium sp. TaxID=1891286 RepID=UPI00264A342A|nr:hypothetical protein [Brachybacterium sp.]MDN5687024.1 hypothetical protein [Brachybacterium sp.]
MTTLYRPVLIESAEQAEALPEGIVLIRDDHYAFQKDKGRFVSTDPHDLPVAHAWEVVGWTALVPIELGEIPETFRNRDGLGTDAHRTVYRTPWEETTP